MAAELSERPSFKRRAGGGAARGGAAAKRACFDGGDDDDDGIRWRELTADERAYVRECMFPGDAELARRLCHGNNASGLP